MFPWQRSRIQAAHWSTWNSSLLNNNHGCPTWAPGETLFMDHHIDTDNGFTVMFFYFFDFVPCSWSRFANTDRKSIESGTNIFNVYARANILLFFVGLVGILYQSFQDIVEKLACSWKFQLNHCHKESSDCYLDADPS